jgi:hypothetical protein
MSTPLHRATSHGDTETSLLAVGHDLIAGQFLTPIQQPETLAQQMYDLCPDIVDQGTGTVEELSESGRLFLWWDYRAC